MSALLTVTLLATLALFSVAQSTEPELKIAYCTLEFGQDTHILYVKVNGGTLEDGFDHELYLKNDEITITLNDGESFSFWVENNGSKLSNEESFEITVSDLLGADDEKTVITISAEIKASVVLKFTNYGGGTCTDTDIVIPKTSPNEDKVTSIGNHAFSFCTNLTSITIPDSVTSIGNWWHYDENDNVTEW